MKINWNYIKLLTLVAMVVFLYSFSSRRNAARKVQHVSIYFTNPENLFITENNVNKLLIVNNDTLTNKRKEILDLNALEKKLDANELIANAEVYLTVNGELGAEITQRKPIARVYAATSFYIDENGKKMPLSKNYTARVPLITGIKDNDIEKIYPLLKKIEADGFLTKHITAIEKENDGNYKLQLRTLDFEVLFGDISAIERKVANFKSFYKKLLKDKKLDAYKTVNLQFRNQVVCTKK